VDSAPARQIRNLLEILPSPAPAKCSRIWRTALQLHYVQLITDKTNAAHLSGGVFAILISVTWMIKIQNPLLFHKFCQKLWQTVTQQRKHWTALPLYSS